MPTFSFAKPIEDVEEPILLEEGWCRAKIVAPPAIAPNKKKVADPESEGAGDNLEVSLMLLGADAEGRRLKIWLPWPSLQDEDSYDGRGMKKSDAKMERIAEFTVKFGGVSDGTDIMLEENMEGFVYIVQTLDQQGEKIINNIDTFAGFRSVEEFEEDEAPPLGDNTGGMEEKEEELPF